MLYNKECWHSGCYPPPTAPECLALFNGIIKIMCTPTTEKYGATPANIQWTVVRGDSATLKIEFYEDDETTEWDTSDWTYVATSYDPNGAILDILPTVDQNGWVEIQVPPSISENWGTTYRSVVAELTFDLEVTIEGGSGINADTVWTPVIGTICVLGDVSGSSL